MRLFIYVCFIIFCGIHFSILDGHNNSANAQVRCPDVIPLAFFSFADVETGTCTQIPAGPSPDNGVVIGQGGAGINLFIDTRLGGVSVAAVTLECIGGTVLPSSIVRANLNSSCQLRATLQSSTGLLTLTGTVSADGVGLQTATNLVITGGAFVRPTLGDRRKITDSLFNALIQADSGIFGNNESSIIGTNELSSGGISFTPTALSLGSEQQPDDPFYRRFGGVPIGGQSQPVGVTTNAGFDFQLDLNALSSQARKHAANLSPNQRQSLADSSFADINLPGHHDHHRSYSGWKTGMKDKHAAREPRFNAWVSVRHVDFDDDQQNADRSGYVLRVTSGLSYRIGERTKLGAFGRIRKGEVDSTALQSSLDSSFYGGGMFGIYQSDDGARLVLSGLYETSDSDIIIQGVSGSFDADQWTVEAVVDKRFTTGRSWIEPSARVVYTEADRDGYVDSAGNLIAGSTLSLGRFTVGPKIGATIVGGGKHIAEIRPYAKLAGVWDFVSEGDFALSTGAVFSTSDNGLNAGGGVEVEFVRGTTLMIAGDWFGTNSELEGWSVSGSLGTSLAALGLDVIAPTSIVSLAVAASAEDQSAKARVAVPIN